MWRFYKHAYRSHQASILNLIPINGVECQQCLSLNAIANSGLFCGFTYSLKIQTCLFLLTCWPVKLTELNSKIVYDSVNIDSKINIPLHMVYDFTYFGSRYSSIMIESTHRLQFVMWTVPNQSQLGI